MEASGHPTSKQNRNRKGIEKGRRSWGEKDWGNFLNKKDTSAGGRIKQERENMM